MIARSYLIWKIFLALLAAAALSGCAHRHAHMMDHPMHHTAKQDARLGELVDSMNAAEGAAKLDAIAAVVNELADQHRYAHACRHKAHGAPGCGCPACPHATGACPHASGTCPHASAPCPRGAGPCPMAPQE